MNQFNRRRFISSTSAAVTAAGVSNVFFPGNAVSAAPAGRSFNDLPEFGFIGTGIRFHTALGHQGSAFGLCSKICDVDAVQAGRAQQVIVDIHHKQKRPIAMTVHEDYRALLDDKNIKFVVIASPDHWHTKQLIDALKAGKDVYCEKPLTLTIAEGKMIEEVVKSTGRIVQVGTQQRTEMHSRFVIAAAMLREKRIGDVKKLTVCLGSAPKSDSIPIVAPPRHLNWDQWLGQAPLVDYRAAAGIQHTTGWGAGHPLSRAHRYYRWFYEYSGGKLTDWGAHHVDIAMLALDKLNDDIGLVKIEPKKVSHPVEMKDGMPTKDDRFNTATSFFVRVKFADGVMMDVRNGAVKDLGFDNGIMFEGSKGRYLVNRGKLVGAPVKALTQNPLKADPFETVYGQPKPKSHMQNFVDCMNSRQQPISDVAGHNRMLNICHAINIAMRLGRELTYDPKKQQFVDDDQANTFISRPQRKGFEITV